MIKAVLDIQGMPSAINRQRIQMHIVHAHRTGDPKIAVLGDSISSISSESSAPPGVLKLADAAAEGN